MGLPVCKASSTQKAYSATVSHLFIFFFPSFYFQVKLFLNSARTDNELEYVQMKTKLYYSGISFFYISTVSLLKISRGKKTNVVASVNHALGDQPILNVGLLARNCTARRNPVSLYKRQVQDWPGGFSPSPTQINYMAAVHPWQQRGTCSLKEGTSHLAENSEPQKAVPFPSRHLYAQSLSG